ncbi:ParB/RepB/Spo0J family partition protein [Paracoccus sp. N5]|uniref:ParB/RepB/Spo0J family partition protein n=1 Tax=Paracoccus sp. N5 TaxID=1101189 RepID=UPI00036A35C8|nr:ParB/RepB/Spo0J family partition protein [Paracoccus sp. N5]
MDTTTKTPARAAGATSIALSEIIGGADLDVRGYLSPQHVHELRQAIRRGDKFGPLLVWQEMGENGMPTGKFVLLDGRHRLAALQAEKRRPAKVLAEVVQGSKAEALMRAAARNTKATLPLTRWQATNAAWAVVRLDAEPGGAAPYSLSKAQIARACATSARTVATMRARWKAWPEGQEPSGDWQRDMKDRNGPPEEIDEEEVMRKQEAEIEKMAQAIRKAVGHAPEEASWLFYEAIGRVLGARAGGLVEWLGGRDGDEDAPVTGIEGDPQRRIGPEPEPEF